MLSFIHRASIQARSGSARSLSGDLSLPITHPTRRKMSGTARSGLFLTARRGLSTSDGVIGRDNRFISSTVSGRTEFLVGTTPLPARSSRFYQFKIEEEQTDVRNPDRFGFWQRTSNAL